MAAVDPNALVDPKQAKKILKSKSIETLIAAAADRRLAEMLPQLPEALTKRCVEELRAIPSLHHALTPLVKPDEDDLNRSLQLGAGYCPRSTAGLQRSQQPGRVDRRDGGGARHGVPRSHQREHRRVGKLAGTGALPAQFARSPDDHEWLSAVASRSLGPRGGSHHSLPAKANGPSPITAPGAVFPICTTKSCTTGTMCLTAAQRVDAARLFLRNVMNFGGVCADQAWFTTTVMEVRGIPAAVVVGRDATVGHAWVGWFEFAGRSARFNTDTGRYESYQKVPGLVKDPQTSGTIGEGRMGMLARFSTLDSKQRQLGRAIRSVLKRVEDRMNLTSEAPTDKDADAIAPTTPADRLNWVNALLAVAPSDPGAWDIVAAASQEGAFTDETLNTFTDTLLAESSDAPDFALEVLEAMAEGLTDAERAGNILERVAGLLARNRPDLAARALLAAGDAFAAAGQQDEAGKRYERITSSYANDGPWVLDAARRVLDVLNDQGRLAANGPAYVESIFNRVKKPEFMSSEWARQSNWYQLGMLLSETLTQTGRPGQGRGRHATARRHAGPQRRRVGTRIQPLKRFSLRSER